MNNLKIITEISHNIIKIPLDAGLKRLNTKFSQKHRNMKAQKYMIYISSGKDPIECCWVVIRVLEEVIKEAKQKNYLFKIIKQENGPAKNTLLFASIEISGKTIQNFIDSWNGSIL